MKLIRFRSDWNGCKSDTAYHKKPTLKQVKTALKEGKTYSENCVIFAKDTCVEVKTSTQNGFNGNIYRDLYSIA